MTCRRYMDASLSSFSLGSCEINNARQLKPCTSIRYCNYSPTQLSISACSTLRIWPAIRPFVANGLHHLHPLKLDSSVKLKCLVGAVGIEPTFSHLTLPYLDSAFFLIYRFIRPTPRPTLATLLKSINYMYIIAQLRKLFNFFKHHNCFNFWYYFKTIYEIVFIRNKPYRLTFFIFWIIGMKEFVFFSIFEYHFIAFIITQFIKTQL